MKLHELKIKHDYLVDVTIGVKTFELRKNEENKIWKTNIYIGDGSPQ